MFYLVHAHTEERDYVGLVFAESKRTAFNKAALLFSAYPEMEMIKLTKVENDYLDKIKSASGGAVLIEIIRNNND